MRSRSRWRIFSRSMATACMRLSSESANTNGIASVNTVAHAAMAANTIVSVLTLIASMRRSSIGYFLFTRRMRLQNRGRIS